MANVFLATQRFELAGRQRWNARATKKDEPHHSQQGGKHE